MLSRAVDSYITFCQVEKLNAKETVLKVRDCFRVWITPVLGDIELESLSLIDTMSLKQAMVSKGTSVARQYSVIITLKTFLRFCIEVLKIKTLDPKEVRLPDRGKPHVLVLTKNEIEQLLKNIPSYTYSGSRLRALVEVLLGTGMRISEALSLNRETFDLNLDRVDVIGKGNKHREIFFTKRCQYWVQNYLSKRYDEHPGLFVTTGYKPERLSRSDISRFFVNLRKKAKLDKKVTPHVLRHTYCTNLLNNGADITFIKELVGHEDIQTTAKYYLSVSKEQLRKVVDKYLDYGLQDEELLDSENTSR